MKADQTLGRIRQFLLVIAAGVFVMTVTELLFLSHWSETIQLLPFALSGWGLIALALAYFRPTPTALNLLRWSMILIGVCSLIGVYEHMANNLGFQMEIQPNATLLELALADHRAAVELATPLDGAVDDLEPRGLGEALELAQAALRARHVVGRDGDEDGLLAPLDLAEFRVVRELRLEVGDERAPVGVPLVDGRDPLHAPELALGSLPRVGSREGLRPSPRIVRGEEVLAVLGLGVRKGGHAGMVWVRGGCAARQGGGL